MQSVMQSPQTDEGMFPVRLRTIAFGRSTLERPLLLEVLR